MDVNKKLHCINCGENLNNCDCEHGWYTSEDNADIETIKTFLEGQQEELEEED